MQCPACGERIEVLCFRPIEARSGIFECGICHQPFTVDKIDEKSNKMTLIRLNRETIEELYREKDLI